MEMYETILFPCKEAGKDFEKCAPIVFSVNPICPNKEAGKQNMISWARKFAHRYRCTESSYSGKKFELDVRGFIKDLSEIKDIGMYFMYGKDDLSIDVYRVIKEDDGYILSSSLEPTKIGTLYMAERVFKY